MVMIQAPLAPAPMHPVDFAQKWRSVDQKESAVAKEHFLDLCRVVGVANPIESDPTGQAFSFEKRAELDNGKFGFADVWKRDTFAWEYKTRGADLDAAYRQLLKYREALDNPPLLIVSDTDRIRIHTNFTGQRKAVYDIDLETMSDAKTLRVLREAFSAPYDLRPEESRADVTEEVAARFAQLSVALEQRGVDRSKAAHLLMQILFCFFAEDTALLPDPLVTRLCSRFASKPETFKERLQALLDTMRDGGLWGDYEIPQFNGGLFKRVEVVDFRRHEIEMLAEAGKLDWEDIEPSIIGVLFERSLDAEKRGQLGKFYTDRREIERVVRSVVIAPLRREWELILPEADRLAAARQSEIADAQRRGIRNPTQSAKVQNATQALWGHLDRFIDRLVTFRVLDPACGSGNFLYVSLAALQEFEKEIHLYGAAHGLPIGFPRVRPDQVLGIEIDPFARELAQVVVWIGYLQWMRDNGFQPHRSPVLSPLETIEHRDALLNDVASGPRRALWPPADVIIGNPPFIGGKRLRTRLGDAYVKRLFDAFDGEVAQESDLCCYFFEQARWAIHDGQSRRAGLLATNSIRGGANRLTLERIKRSGDIFMAWDDEPWVLDGAAVRISIVGFDDGSETERSLDGAPAEQINADLTGTVDVTRAVRLAENHAIGLMGDTKGGPFEVNSEIAKSWLSLPTNPNGRLNSDVVKPWINGLDVTRRPRHMWVVDFGTEPDEKAAALYEAPFAHVLKHVYPVRSQNNRESYRRKWWLHVEPRPLLRSHLATRRRVLVTPTVARHRVFVWMDSATVIDHALIAFARDDDYFFGVLQSRAHEVWSLRAGTSLGKGNDPRYTPTTCFETFPLPWSPGHEPTGEPCHVAIADAARRLNDQRVFWLNPPDITEADLKKRTLTNLYNQRPTWLLNSHAALDGAIWAAYGWPLDEVPSDVPDDIILARLLALNIQRSRPLH